MMHVWNDLEGLVDLSNSIVFPEYIVDLAGHINGLEMVTLTIAIKLWCSKLSLTRLTHLCDNVATVAVVNSGHSKDSFLQACLRELCVIQLCISLRFMWSMFLEFKTQFQIFFPGGQVHQILNFGYLW